MSKSLGNNMIDLDDVAAIKSADKHQVITATNNLWRQCQDAWDQTLPIKLPSDYLGVSNVIIAGMGGSHLGGELIKSVYDSELRFPLTIKSNYQTPGYVDENCLVIATSYSGTTEEVLEFAKTSLKKAAKIICISSGGPLSEFAINNDLPRYVFDDSHTNPSSIPRYGSGYLLMSQLVFLQKIRDLDIEHSEAAEVVDHLKLQQARFGIDIPTAHNPAKQLAHELYQKNVIIVASEHLVGSAYIFKNQINESAKQFSTMFEIPELNHHLLEGLAHPKDLSLQSAFFFLESHRYHPRIRARYPITRNIISDQEFGTPTYKPESNSKLTEAVEVVAFTSYVALYLSLLNTVDPGPNPWVDRLKSELSQLT